VIGLATTPLAPEDADDVVALWRECEQIDEGEAVFTEEDFIAVSNKPSFDFARDSVGLRDGGRLVALGFLDDERHAYVHVAPSHRGQGIGSWLLGWTQAAGREAGHRFSGQTICDGRDAVAELLRADGYTPRWDSWVLAIKLDRTPENPQLPPGYVIRDLVPGSGDDRAVHRVIDDAFADWPDRERWPFEDWTAETLGRPGFKPENIPLVGYGDDVVGAAVLIDDEAMGWVDQLAVARAHRGRGLARALLVHAFGIAWRAHKPRCELATDSRTGALGLYERVGMRVKRRYTQYAKPL
jgi:GNAT superfamily N-acetyltransferase